MRALILCASSRRASVADQLYALVQETCQSLSLALVRLKFFEESPPRLQIMIEHADGAPPTIQDCAKLSRALSRILTPDDGSPEVLDFAYHLEVSSPGIPRPLTRFADFMAAVGGQVRLRTRERTSHTGVLAQVNDLEITLVTGHNELSERVVIPFCEISKAERTDLF